MKGRLCIRGTELKPGTVLTVVVSYPSSLPFTLSLFLSSACQKWIPPWIPPPASLQLCAAALSVNYRLVATFEHGTELLWSNSYKMPNKTYGQQLPESRSLYTTMDHCYGTDDVMTEPRSALLLFIFPVFLRRNISFFFIFKCFWWCHVCYSTVSHLWVRMLWFLCFTYMCLW